MTDRHLHCVYFKYDNASSPEGFCLLKQEKIEFGYKPHCQDYVLRPHDILSYYIMNETECDDWGRAEDIANGFIRKCKFNYYPKIR